MKLHVSYNRQTRKPFFYRGQTSPNWKVCLLSILGVTIGIIGQTTTCSTPKCR